MSDETGILRNFGQFLASLEDGRFNRDVSDAQRELIQALNNLPGGKGKGTIALTLNFSLDGGVVEVTTDYKVKAPKLARGRSVFWATPENNLTQRNPAQIEMPFRDVTVPSARGLA